MTPQAQAPRPYLPQMGGSRVWVPQAGEYQCKLNPCSSDTMDHSDNSFSRKWWCHIHCCHHCRYTYHLWQHRQRRFRRQHWCCHSGCCLHWWHTHHLRQNVCEIARYNYTDVCYSYRPDMHKQKADVITKVSILDLSLRDHCPISCSRWIKLPKPWRYVVQCLPHSCQKNNNNKKRN